MEPPPLLSTILVLLVLGFASSLNSVWRWECEQGFCQKKLITPATEDTALSLAACRLFCSKSAALWPIPTGTVTLGNVLVKVNPNNINVLSARSSTSINNLTNAALKNFQEQVLAASPSQARASGGKALNVNLVIRDQNINRLALGTDESYDLEVSEESDGSVNATILAETFFGGRHGLETLGQLIIFDDLRNELQMPRDVSITDGPAFGYRGILLDTARNYISVDAIKRTINGMGASKLNTFHWHITDSHSFPYVSESQPELSKYGAYSPAKIYSPQDVEDIVNFGLERGVRVIPEFDAPAHVGEGWQNTDFVTCFNKQPWDHYCVEPPCGQFDPTKEGLYDVLEDIYGDMIRQFQPDIFHMGGDEVHFGCWNTTPNIVEWMKTEKQWGREEEDFVKLWDHFQSEALARLYKRAGRQIPVIMWTSTLTQNKYLVKSLPKDKYIIQIWTTGRDPQVAALLENGYQVILSNYDALYLDCGFAGWVQGGHNWCSPYKGWQTVYENKPGIIAGTRKNLVLGAEATLWTEQADSSSVDGRLWPRAAAMAEVLWSDPETDWRAAEPRILVHRERLVARGIEADALEPEWCLQNEENCPVKGRPSDGDDDLGPGAATMILTPSFIIYLVQIIASCLFLK